MHLKSYLKDKSARLLLIANWCAAERSDVASNLATDALGDFVCKLFYLGLFFLLINKAYLLWQLCKHWLSM